MTKTQLTIEDVRKRPTPLPHDIVHIPLPSFSLSCIILKGIVRDIEYLRSSSNALPGFEQVARSLNISRDFTIRVHSLIDICLNEYAQNCARRDRTGTIDPEKVTKFVKKSLSENGDKIKAFIRDFNHSLESEVPFLDDLKAVCQVRDLLQHYEAHRYTGRDVPAAFNEMGKRLGLSDPSPMQTLGPFGMINSVEYANKVNQVLVHFLNALLKPYANFQEHGDISEISNRNDLLFLVEDFNFVHLRKILESFEQENGNSISDNERVTVARCMKGYVIGVENASGKFLHVFDQNLEKFSVVRSMDELQAIDFDEEDRMWIVYPPESYSLSDIEILSSMLRH